MVDGQLRDGAKAALLRDARAELQKRKDRIERLEVLAKGRREPFWKALRAELDFSIEVKEKELAGVLDADGSTDPAAEFARAKQRRGSILAYKGIIEVVEKAEERAALVNDRVAELSENIKLLEASGPAATKRSKGVV